MKLAIVGSRSFGGCTNDYEILRSKIFNLFKLKDIHLIISGGARGADTLAEKFAKEFGIPKRIHFAGWEVYGRSAGYVRNARIVQDADKVVAFWDGKSRGTANTIKLAKDAGKEVFVVNV